MATRRLHELDALRGLAAVAVVAYHYLDRYGALYGGGPDATGLGRLAHFGQHGVQLFFILSGFVIYWSLSRAATGLDFVVGRFSRLYPVYWVSVATTFVVVALAGLPGRGVAPLDAVLNLTMLQAFVGAPHVDGVYWTLTVELIFYAWVFLFFAAKRLDAIDGFLAVVAGGYALSRLAGLDPPAVVVKLLIAEHAAYFLAGVCFYKLLNGHDGWRSRCLLAVSLAVAVGGQPVASGGLIAALYGLFYLAASGRAPLLAVRPLLVLGAVSYPLYLIHQNVGYVILRELSRRGVLGLPAAVVAFAACFALAYGLHRGVEQPALRFLRGRYRRWREGPALPGADPPGAEVEDSPRSAA